MQTETIVTIGIWIIISIAIYKGFKILGLSEKLKALNSGIKEYKKTLTKNENLHRRLLKEREYRNKINDEI